MIRVTKNGKESNEKLISRFMKLVQASRIPLIAKSKMHFKKAMKTSEVRRRAIMRDHFRELREKRKFM